MGRQRIQIGDQDYELDEDTSITDLKRTVGAAETDLTTYVEKDGTWGTVSDRDKVKHIPENASVAFQPDDTHFGG